MACRVMPAVLSHVPKYSKYSRYVAGSPDLELAGTVFAVLFTAGALALYPVCRRLPVPGL